MISSYSNNHFLNSAYLPLVGGACAPLPTLGGVPRKDDGVGGQHGAARRIHEGVEPLDKVLLGAHLHNLALLLGCPAPCRVREREREGVCVWKRVRSGWGK